MSSAGFCISIFFDQGLIGIQERGSSRLGGNEEGEGGASSGCAGLTPHFISHPHWLGCKVLSARVGRLPPYFISQPLLAGPRWIAARMTSRVAQSCPAIIMIVIRCSHHRHPPPTSQMLKRKRVKAKWLVKADIMVHDREVKSAHIFGNMYINQQLDIIM